jgi:hypothetical protein
VLCKNLCNMVLHRMMHHGSACAALWVRGNHACDTGHWAP